MGGQVLAVTLEGAHKGMELSEGRGCDRSISNDEYEVVHV